MKLRINNCLRTIWTGSRTGRIVLVVEVPLRPQHPILRTSRAVSTILHCPHLLGQVQPNTWPTIQKLASRTHQLWHRPLAGIICRQAIFRASREESMTRSAPQSATQSSTYEWRGAYWAKIWYDNTIRRQLAKTFLKSKNKLRIEAHNRGSLFYSLIS